MRDLGMLCTMLGPGRRRVGWLVVLMVVAALLESLGVWLVVPVLASLFDADVPRGLPGVLSPLARWFPGVPVIAVLLGALLGLCVLKTAVRVYQKIATARFRWQLRRLWATAILERYLRSDCQTMARHRLGELTDTLMVRTRHATTCVWETLECLVAALHVVALLVVVAVVFWPLAAALAVMGLFAVVATRPVWRVLRTRLGQEQVEAHRECHAVASECLLGYRDIKAYGAESRCVAAFAQGLDRHARVMVRHAAVQTLPRPLGELVLVGSLLLLYLAIESGSVVFTGETLVLLGFGLVVTRRLISQASAMLSHGSMVAGLLPGLAAVAETMQPAGSAVERRGERSLPVGLAELRAERLTFGYAGRPAVFEDVSFTIPARGVTAIVGPSGIGKSTLVDLLTGFLAPTSGRICYGGIDLDDLDLDRWRSRMGYVSQDSMLFHGTVRENLLLAEPDAGEHRLREACRAAGAFEFVEGLSQGLDTVVGSRGSCLSGGQQQRLVMARALLRNPDILILDEATNSLDRDHAERVWLAIDQLRKTKMIILIAHHLPPMAVPDVVLRIDGRSIVEETSIEQIGRRTNELTPAA